MAERLATHEGGGAPGSSGRGAEPGDTPRVVDVGNRGLRALALVAVGFAVLPIVVAVARAVAGHWLPTGDEGVFAIRARDVFTVHPPLLGTWTSASLSTHIDVNNPGALYYDLLAVPVRVFGSSAGTAIGVGIANCAAVVGVAIAAARRGGSVLVTVAMAVTGALVWSMGTEVLFSPIQPLALVLPFLCFLALAWCVAAGDLAVVPWLALVATLLVQTHVVYLVVVPVLVVVALAGLALDLRHRSRGDGASVRAVVRRVATTAAIAFAVLAVVWLQPVIEQLTNPDMGNLTRLYRSAGQPSRLVGFPLGARLVAAVATLPPWWFRPSFRTSFVHDDARRAVPGTVAIGDVRVPSLTAAIVSLVVLAALLALCAWFGRRRRDRAVVTVAATAIAAVAAGVWNAHRIPVGPLGLSQHVLRWVWPIGAFAALALAVSIVRLCVRTTRCAGVVASVFTAGAIAFGSLNLPSSVQLATSPRYPADPSAVMRAVDRQLGRLEGGGPYLFDVRGLPFGDYASTAILAELQRRGIPFVLSDRAWLRQLGPARRFDGRNARAVLTERLGDSALETPRGARRVALHRGLRRSEEREMRRLEARIAAYLADHPVLPLNARGRRALHRATVPVGDSSHLLTLGPLAALFENRYLALDPVWSRTFDRALRLRYRWDDGTVAVVVAPLDT